MSGERIPLGFDGSKDRDEATVITADGIWAHNFTMTMTAIESAFDRLSRAAKEMGRHVQIMRFRGRGWDDLADVIESREGTMIVRNGMREALPWLRDDVQ